MQSNGSHMAMTMAITLNSLCGRLERLSAFRDHLDVESDAQLLNSTRRDPKKSMWDSHI